MNVLNRLFGRESTSTSMTATERELVAQLQQMGFEENPALFAVRSAQGNLEHAITILTENQTSATTTTRATIGNRAGAQTPGQRAAAAALSRSQQDGIKRNRNAPMRSREEPRDAHEAASRIKALAQQLAVHPQALDALFVIVKAIANAPTEQKFKRISSNNKIYKQTIAGCAPAGRLLEELGFSKQRSTQSSFDYVLKSTDSALLWLGKSALEEQKQSGAYKQAKETLAFEKALKLSLSSASTEEAARRQAYKAQIPDEPVVENSISAISHIHVNLGGSIFSRHFYGDEAVLVLIQWLGTLSSILPDKLISGEWELVDNSLYPPKVVPVSSNLESSLQAMDWSPSAVLLVKPLGSPSTPE